VKLNKNLIPFVTLFLISTISAFENGRVSYNLNGHWTFEQTLTAFPPEKFTRSIVVPGLVNLAQPKIEDYNRYFPRPEKVDYNMEHNLLKAEYKPKYSWYKRRIKIPKELKGKHANLQILKSKYVTTVYINGIDIGTSMACYTPIDFPATEAVRFGEENEILIRVGDRKWLPSQAAGSTDKEKVNYLPGIWDNVTLSFTGPFRIHRSLILPSIKEKKITAKLLLRSFLPSQATYGAQMLDSCRIVIRIREKQSGRQVAQTEIVSELKRDNITHVNLEIVLEDAHLWTPEDPFLYEADITVLKNDDVSDLTVSRFAMRDFYRQGRHFYLNGKKIVLRGTNITLHRFFEDPDCQGLPWDKQWVKKLLVDIPKQLNWNTMRICVGIAPKLWYDIADEYGLLIQNEWLYWQLHGWDEQVRQEYSDWVWSDGNHPSIVIWDAINENWDEYIGNQLIPELKRLDPTRIWDAGYMTADHMDLDEMDEPHPYMVYGIYGAWLGPSYDEYIKKLNYPLGDLHYWPEKLHGMLYASAAQLVNEYGWMWLWRDGRPAKLMKNSLPYYLGQTPTTEERRFFQAYWEQLQTEWLRSERSLAGVLAFCYLTNNYGYTGDWFIDEVKDLKPAPALNWFQHAFAPVAVFIDITDQRYMKQVFPYDPGSLLLFNLVGVNDYPQPVSGEIDLQLLDATGKIAKQQKLRITIPAYLKTCLPVSIQLPSVPGGYLVLASFTPEIKQKVRPVLSRRYIKVGFKDVSEFFELEIEDIE
jgi:beta-galactosidase